MTTTETFAETVDRLTRPRSFLDTVRAATLDLTDADVLAADIDARAGDAVALGYLCHDLDRLITAARDARREVGAALVGHLKALGARTKLLELPGVGAAQRMPGGTTTAWDSDALVPRVVAAALDPAHRVNPDTGELADPVDAVVAALVTAARLEWRAGDRGGTTGLRSLGIDPDDYRATDRQPDTVRIIDNSGGE